MTVVVDANILVAYGLSDEPLHTQANDLLASWQGSETPLAAPQLFRSEITAVVRKAVFQKRIRHEQGRKLLAQLLAYPVNFHEDDALLKTSYELAEQFNRPRAYDAQYLALAQRLSSEFWTADERLFNAIQANFPTIRWLGSWQPDKQST
ncbi:type II toxin-antitoxin system VapC family toxin [bacterium]|nr:type II toxin-antitoxin system VapC family toxin [bacterium]